ncbi:MAG: membrane protein [Paraglaciecola sp.]|jgi:membrane protein
MKFKFPKIKDIKTVLLEHPDLLRFVDWTKRTSLPGFFTIPIYDVIVFLWNEILRFDLGTRANSMAFSFFLALFPSLIFLYSLATHFPIYENFKEEINNLIDQIMKSEAGDLVKNSIPEIFDPKSGVLSLGFILAIFFASNGILAMMRSFEKSHLKHTFKKRSLLRKRLVAIGLTSLLGVLLFASVILVMMGNFLINFVTELAWLSDFTGVLLQIFRWLVTLALIYSVIAAIYRFGAATIIKFKFFTPGATLATVLSILTSVAFSYYASSYGRYDRFYGPAEGTIVGIIVLMLWIQINCFILLVGFELNASIAVNRDLKSKVEGDDD